jgi:hypothetical protein
MSGNEGQQWRMNGEMPQRPSMTCVQGTTKLKTVLFKRHTFYDLLNLIFILITFLPVKFNYSLAMTLDQYEKQIVKVCKSPLPRDVETLQTLVIEHQQFEQNVNRHEPEINQVKNLFERIPQKTAKEQQLLDKVLAQWDRIWQFSAYYVERLKVVEVTLTELDECVTIVTDFEMKLASYDSMPGDMDNLRKAHDDLMTLEAEIQEKQV